MTAQCSLHPESEAISACTRCGRFCCHTCLVERDPPLCWSCASSVKDPFEIRARYLDALQGMFTAIKLVRSELVTILLITLVFSIPASLLHLALENAQSESASGARQTVQLDNAYDGFIGIIGTQAIVLLFFARLEGRRLTFGQAMREGGSRWGRGVGTNIRSGLWTLLFFLFLIIPGIWKSVMFAWTSIAAMRVREDPLPWSEQLVRGRFWTTFGYLLVSSVPVIIATAFNLALNALLDSLEAPYGVGAAGLFVQDFVLRFADDALTAAMMVCGFVMVHRDANVTLPPMEWNTGTPPLADQSLSRST
ncbi:MAG: B-box zinc finger protein [Archangium sp.]